MKKKTWSLQSTWNLMQRKGMISANRLSLQAVVAIKSNKQRYPLNRNMEVRSSPLEGVLKLSVAVSAVEEDVV